MFSKDGFFEKISQARAFFLASDFSCHEVFVLEINDELDTLVALMSLLSLKKTVALLNPKSSPYLKNKLLEKLGPHTLVNDVQFAASDNTIIDFDYQTPSLLMATSGSSSEPKWIASSLEMWYFSVQGTIDHLEAKCYEPWILNLPLFHVSGLSVFFRCLILGAPCVISKKLIPITHARVSMIPLQLERALCDNSHHAYLNYKSILIGGAKLSAQLFASTKHLPIYITYGMTEALSQITCSKKSPSALHEGIPLKGRKIFIDEKQRIYIKGLSVADYSYQLGQLIYLKNDEGYYDTKDCGFFNAQGQLELLGRHDERLESHGEKTYPIVVEQSLAQFFPFKKIFITHITSDNHQVIVAFCDPLPSQEDLKNLKQKAGSLFFPSFFFRLQQQDNQQKILISELKKQAKVLINS